MNRSDFQQLADDRIRDAKALLSAKRWSGAYYLAGYSIECALKACIAKLTKKYDFPDKKFVQSCHTHEIERLVDLANLKEARDTDTNTNEKLGTNWLKVKDWNESARYQQKSEAEARELYRAVSNPKNGVMQWIKSRW